MEARSRTVFVRRGVLYASWPGWLLIGQTYIQIRRFQWQVTLGRAAHLHVLCFQGSCAGHHRHFCAAPSSYGWREAFGFFNRWLRLWTPARVALVHDLISCRWDGSLQWVSSKVMLSIFSQDTGGAGRHVQALREPCKTWPEWFFMMADRGRAGAGRGRNPCSAASCIRSSNRPASPESRFGASHCFSRRCISVR